MSLTNILQSYKSYKPYNLGETYSFPQKTTDLIWN